ncbi:uncharacterized protein [Pyxicephalus adspersus]|uniref:uncharacterized protein isoform X2 n=1 Tax=Pyxicephalus adspersus TaxID=30357 RepID=UPI003B5C7C65
MSEVLVKNDIQETEIFLTVLDRVHKPIIIDRSTEEEIILHCESSTPNVTYKWLNKAGEEILSTDQKYIAPRPKENVALICTVTDGWSEERESIRISPGRTQIYIIIIIIIMAAILVCCRSIAGFMFYKRFYRRSHKPGGVRTMSGESDYLPYKPGGVRTMSEESDYLSDKAASSTSSSVTSSSSLLEDEMFSVTRNTPLHTESADLGVNEVYLYPG